MSLRDPDRESSVKSSRKFSSCTHRMIAFPASCSSSTVKESELEGLFSNLFLHRRLQATDFLSLYQLENLSKRMLIELSFKGWTTEPQTVFKHSNSHGRFGIVHGGLGKNSSDRFKNAGPWSHWQEETKDVASIPRIAMSAGLSLDGTYFHCSAVVLSSILVNLLEIKTGKCLLVFRIICKTAVESDQNTEFLVEISNFCFNI